MEKAKPSTPEILEELQSVDDEDVILLTEAEEFSSEKKKELHAYLRRYVFKHLSGLIEGEPLFLPDGILAEVKINIKLGALACKKDEKHVKELVWKNIGKKSEGICFVGIDSNGLYVYGGIHAADADMEEAEKAFAESRTVGEFRKKGEKEEERLEDIRQAKINILVNELVKELKKEFSSEGKEGEVVLGDVKEMLCEGNTLCIMVPTRSADKSKKLLVMKDEVGQFVKMGGTCAYKIDELRIRELYKDLNWDEDFIEKSYEIENVFNSNKEDDNM
jgi:hypothetical protein